MHRLNAFVFREPASLLCSAEGEGAIGTSANSVITAPSSTGGYSGVVIGTSVPGKPTVDDSEPKFLSDRLERERRATLKKLGIEVDRDEDASSAIEKAKKKFDTRKAERDSLRDRVKTLETEAQKTASDTAAVKVYAEAEMSALSEAQRDAVKKAAGESPSEQLKTIGAWRSAGMLISAPPATPADAPAPKTPNEVAAPPVAAAAVDTAPPANAPPPVTTSPANHRQQYDSLRRADPFAAARYAAEHPDVYGSNNV